LFHKAFALGGIGAYVVHDGRSYYPRAFQGRIVLTEGGVCYYAFSWLHRPGIRSIFSAQVAFGAFEKHTSNGWTHDTYHGCDKRVINSYRAEYKIGEEPKK